MNRTRELVENALAIVKPPFDEDIVDEVFGVIQNDSGLLAEYWKIIKDEQANERFVLGPRDMNPNVSYFVKKVTHARILGRGVPCKKNSLAQKYSKLILPV